MDTTRRPPWLQGLALFLLTLAAYAPAARCGYVFDDDVFLTDNPLIHAADGLRGFWFSTAPSDYFPLTSTTLWLEWRLWGADPAGYHVVNVLLHAAGSVLLWRVLLRLRVPGAWIGAALFALHPVCVQSVAWITQRKNTLPLALSLLSLLAWLRSEDAPPGRRRPAAYAASLLAFLLALLSKTSVVTLPLVLLAGAW
ncbi:MAG TPA: O-GlcNAc transferase, partial [Planctomycetota bacterium]|nr:O-GlcNAc transferase [Planctomycetota bacterium]